VELTCAVLPVDEILGGRQTFLIDGRQRDVATAGVLDSLRAVGLRPRMDLTTGTELLSKFRVLWIELALGFLFGAEVIEIAEELVEGLNPSF
jgi:hypothetical protein